jgi:hypothetical protein
MEQDVIIYYRNASISRRATNSSRASISRDAVTSGMLAITSEPTRSGRQQQERCYNKSRDASNRRGTSDSLSAQGTPGMLGTEKTIVATAIMPAIAGTPAQ